MKRKFSISAPRLAVRPHVPWYVRWAITLPFILGSGMLVWWAYDSGLELAGFHRSLAEDELSKLRERVTFLETDNAKLANLSAADERKVQIEHSAMLETSSQLKSLNVENLRLKEDLMFFQDLPLKGGKDSDLSIHRMKVEPGSLPGEYHCRLLLVQNVQRRAREFKGNMQLLANGVQGGKKVVIQFPKENSVDIAAHRLSFKYYQRIDRIFTIPDGMVLESVEVRVFKKGASEPKVKQTIDLN